MLVDFLPCVGIHGLVALERCVRGQRVDDGRAREREAHGCGLKDPYGDMAGRAVGELRHDGEEEERDNTAGDAATCHLALTDLRHGAPDVTALKKRTDDADKPDEQAVLSVTPVEQVKRQEGQGELDAGEETEEKEVRLLELVQQRDATLNVVCTRQLWRVAVLSRLVGMSVRFLLFRGNYNGIIQDCPASFRQRIGEEKRFRAQENKRQEGRNRVDVYLKAACGQASRNRSGREVCTDGRADDETNRKCNADVSKRFASFVWRSDVGNDGTGSIG